MAEDKNKYYTEAAKEGRKESALKYRAAVRKRVELNMSIEDYEEWKDAADAEGLPFGTFIRKAVNEYLGKK